MKKTTFYKLFAFFFVGIFISSNTLRAEEMQMMSIVEGLQQTIAQMKRTIDEQTQQIAVQNKKINELETRTPRITTGPSYVENGLTEDEFAEKFDARLKEKIGKSDRWLKDLKFKADYRLRYEAFNFTRGAIRSGDDARNRFRFRLRFGFEKKFRPDMNVGFYLASDDNVTSADPTSTNATFDGLFDFKGISIERAWATYKPVWAMVGPITEVEFTAGKFANPFEQGSSKIIWDRDVRPEGVYEKINLALIRNSILKSSLYAVGGQFILDEDGSGDDAELFAAQVGLTHEIDLGLQKPVAVLNAISWYSYNGYAENGNFGSLTRNNINIDGDPTTLDAGDFEIAEFYNEVKFPKVLMGQDVKAFFDIATNTESSANNRDLAWALGGKVGSAKSKGNWEVGYEYRWIEADSTVGAFNDSDFGNGHTDKRGSVISVGYGITDDLTINGAAYFVNNITGPDSSTSLNMGDVEQRRFQVDLVWKFG